MAKRTTMKSITSTPKTICSKQIKNAFLLLTVAVSFSVTSNAQFRTYSKVFSDNIKGGTTMLGNTLTHIVNAGVADTAKMNNNRGNGNSSFGNDNSNIQYVDIDLTIRLIMLDVNIWSKINEADEQYIK